jgi:hypothetical protein
MKNPLKNKLLTIAGLIVLVGLALFALIQLIPYGRNHTNPPVVNEPQWDSPQTRALAVRACYDCHSNAVVWPWYSSIAPVSWLTQRDVDEGRSALNFSEWSGPTTPTGMTGFGVAGMVLNGKMPPAIYLPLHPAANLTSAEKQQLAQGLKNSLH